MFDPRIIYNVPVDVLLFGCGLKVLDYDRMVDVVCSSWIPWQSFQLHQTRWNVVFQAFVRRAVFWSI